MCLEAAHPLRSYGELGAVSTRRMSSRVAHATKAYAQIAAWIRSVPMALALSAVLPKAACFHSRRSPNFSKRSRRPCEETTGGPSFVREVHTGYTARFGEIGHPDVDTLSRARPATVVRPDAEVTATTPRRRIRAQRTLDESQFGGKTGVGTSCRRRTRPTRTADRRRRRRTPAGDGPRRPRRWRRTPTRAVVAPGNSPSAPAGHRQQWPTE